MSTPYAYEVTTTYLVRAGSVAHNTLHAKHEGWALANAVLREAYGK